MGASCSQAAPRAATPKSGTRASSPGGSLALSELGHADLASLRVAQHHRSASEQASTAGIFTPPASDGAPRPSDAAPRVKRWSEREGSVMSSETRRRRRAALESVTFDLAGRAKRPWMSVGVGAIVMFVLVAGPLVALGTLSRRPEVEGNPGPPSPQQVRDALREIVTERLAARRADDTSMRGAPAAGALGSVGASAQAPLPLSPPLPSRTTEKASPVPATATADAPTTPGASLPERAEAAAHAQLAALSAAEPDTPATPAALEGQQPWPGLGGASAGVVAVSH
ncbi:hypothetical protein KFE25_002733 [Diacronema lutheri]|uniref:Uncharacterized protein n=1 Tax=Diacronema lutheri TaxID=2081491 RepID=A0A8J6CBU1_DIALT|nr:hypothetical protein KFE25_002733 [Diacronema lutheri]